MFKTVGVIGSGLMGSGIAEVCARAGCEVVVREVNDDLLKRGLARIGGTTRLSELTGCEILLEAIIEKMDDKKRLFTELDGLCPPAVIFASNTSSLSITEMASVTTRPERFLGLHFFNPVPVMRPVEMIRGLRTAEDTLGRCRAFCEGLGKRGGG